MAPVYGVESVQLETIENHKMVTMYGMSTSFGVVLVAGTIFIGREMDAVGYSNKKVFIFDRKGIFCYPFPSNKVIFVDMGLHG